MQDTAVSVIIRTFNRATMLKDALDSVLNQTMLPGEILVIDDGSTDETPDLMASYCRRAPYIHYLRLPENHGMDFAQQIGFKETHGDYVAFLDSDDVWLPLHLERCVEALRGQLNSAMVFGKYGQMDIQRQSLVSEVNEPEISSPPLDSFLFKRIIVQPTRSVYKRKAILDAGGMPFCGIASDWVLSALVASMHPQGVIQLPERTVYFRLHESQSFSRPEQVRDDLLISTEYIFERLPAERQCLKRQVIALNLLHAAVFFWQTEKIKGAWQCLLKAVRTNPRCLVSTDFRVALSRLLIHPALGRIIRNWKRTAQRRQSNSSVKTAVLRPTFALRGTEDKSLH
jgi:glycosyltransferase involved in cell wall biosynthesis